MANQFKSKYEEYTQGVDILVNTLELWSGLRGILW